jgi:nucleoside-diphosphate-sugar epimerase
MRRLLICGATGFIGRNLAESLAGDPKYAVTAVYHRRPPFKKKGLTWIQADLTRKEDVARAVEGQDVILQAAATTSGVRTTVANPSVQIVDNAVMNSYLFASAHEQGVEHMVFPSCTIMLASAAERQRENDYDPRVPPHPIYEGAAYTKLYFEHLCAFYARQGRTKFTVLRHSNVYGPNDKFDLQTSHVCGATITKVLTAVDGRILVWGTGEERRDLLYVDDLVSAFVAAVEHQKDAFGLFNIGLGRSVSVRELVEEVVKCAGSDLKIVYEANRPTVKTSVTLDCAKAEAELGWKPVVSLESGLRRTIDWWRENQPIS